VNYDYPAMTTQSGFAFWSPIYRGTRGFTHVIPSGGQLGAGGELRIPIKDIDLTGELVYVHNETREALEGFQATNTERLGTLEGYSYYVQLGWWPLGNRDINGVPGYGKPIHIDFDKQVESPKRALQLLAKWEQLHVNYDSAARGGVVDTTNLDGKIKVNVIELGANYWATKHIRISCNYLFNMFPDSAPSSSTTPTGPKQSSDQRAIAPAQTLDKGVDDDARDNGHALHELLFRFAVAL